ncbi:MAG: exosortase system-associated protein, TIGR04073 family [Candidatus Omnitrophica bacterium]|nr:exosortase system-associated protein, TIGR04073 family [Candidatus Omnitrophota bacterium]
MKQALLILCAVATLFLVVTQAWAQVEPITAAAGLNTYGMPGWRQQDKAMGNSDFLKAINARHDMEDPIADTPAEKFGDGMINTVTSWTDVPRDVADTSEQDNVFWGMTYGLGQGLASGFTRGVSGIVDVATCGISPYDEPAVKPEYKVDKPQQEGYKVALLKW